MEFEAGSAATTEAGGRRRAGAYPAGPRGRPEFPGCRAITLTRDELATYEGRFEFWDGRHRDRLGRARAPRRRP